MSDRTFAFFPDVVAEATRYGAILCDPPWLFNQFTKKNGGRHRSVDDHYKTMSFEELCELQVAEVCKPDAALFLWVVQSHLDKGIELGIKWGFKYKSVAFNWVKVQKGDSSQAKMGMGLWTRTSTELCLLFTRGRPSRNAKNIRQIIMQPLRENSRKPDIYEQIECLVDGPYLEMFARQQVPNWNSFGNETEKFEYKKCFKHHSTLPMFMVKKAEISL